MLIIKNLKSNLKNARKYIRIKRFGLLRKMVRLLNKVEKKNPLFRIGTQSPITNESLGEAPRVLERAQAHPLRDQHLTGHNPHVGRGRSDYIMQRSGWLHPRE